MSVTLIEFPFNIPFVGRDGKVDLTWQRVLIEFEHQIATKFAPDDAPFVTYRASVDLSNEFDLGSLTSGLLKQTVAVGTSTPAIATAGVDYTVLADFAADPIMGIDGNGVNTGPWNVTYYSDGVHPTVAGSTILAGIIAPVINAL